MYETRLWTSSMSYEKYLTLDKGAQGAALGGR